MDKKLENLALKFFEYKAIKFSKKGFKFNLHAEHPEAPLSPNYLNLRDVFRHPEIRKIIAEIFASEVKKIKPDLLVDLPQSISPIVTTVSDLTGIPMISVRSEALKGAGKKDHGVAQSINGIYKKGQKALILDDLVSSYAFTKIKAIAVLKKAGLKVVPKILVVVDRNEGGKENLQKKRFGLVSLLNLKNMFKLYLKNKLISKTVFEKSLKYSAVAKKYGLKNK